MSLPKRRNVVQKIYGIDYNVYACSGIGNNKFLYLGTEREFFYNEYQMLKRLTKLKRIKSFKGFEMFVSKIIKEKYNI
jgi:hypothetical protein